MVIVGSYESIRILRFEIYAPKIEQYVLCLYWAISTVSVSSSYANTITFKCNSITIHPIIPLNNPISHITQINIILL